MFGQVLSTRIHWPCRTSGCGIAGTIFVLLSSASLRAQASVSAARVKATMPDIGIGLHASVYANQFGNAVAPGRFAESGIELPRSRVFGSEFYPQGFMKTRWGNTT